MAAAAQGMEVELAGTRVCAVADKLRDKASEAAAKGNRGAARSLTESADDLRRAAALLAELQRQLQVASMVTAPRSSLTRRPSADGSVSGNAKGTATPPPSSTNVKELVAKLRRVEAMLEKKSDEMKQKGNENAAHALHQSSLTVRLGVQHMVEQQMMTRALAETGRGLREQLQALCALLMQKQEHGEEQDDTEVAKEDVVQQAMEQAKELVQLQAIVRAVYPEAETLDALRAAMTKETTEPSQRECDCERLKQQLAQTLAGHEEELKTMRIEHAEELDKANVMAQESRNHAQQQEQEMLSLKVQADEWASQLQEQTRAMDELQDSHQEEITRHANEMEELRARLSAFEKEADTYRQRESELMEALEHEKATSEAQRAEHASVMEAMQKTVQTEYTEKSGLVSQQRDDAEIQALKEEIERSEESCNDLRSELARLRDLLAEEKASSEQQQVDHKIVIAQMQSDLDALRSKERNVGEDVDTPSSEEQLGHEAALEELQALADKYMKQCEQLGTDLTARETVIGELKTDLDGLRQKADDSDTARAMLSDAQTQLAEEQRRVAEYLALIEQERVAHEQSVLALRESAEDQQRGQSEHTAEVETRLQQALMKVEQNEAKFVELETGHEKQRREIDVLEATISALRVELSELRQGNDELMDHNGEIHIAKQRFEQLLDLIKNLTRVLESDDWGTISGSLSAISTQDDSEDDSEIRACIMAIKTRLSRIATQALEVQQERDTSYADVQTAVLSTCTVLGEALKLANHPYAVDADNSSAIENMDVVNRVRMLLNLLESDVLTIFKDMKENVEHLTAREEELLTMESQLTARIDDINVECEQLRVEIAHSKEEETSLRANIEMLTIENAGLNRQMEEITEAKQTLEVNAEKTVSATEQETDLLREQIKTLENDFEKYRTRSRTALKKIEKRAELLNGMRKENEKLSHQVGELERKLVDVAEMESAMQQRYTEAMHTLGMRDEEWVQRLREAVEKESAVNVEYNAMVEKVHVAQENLQQCGVQLATLQAEKDGLTANLGLQYQEQLAAKDRQLESSAEKLAAALDQAQSLSSQSKELQVTHSAQLEEARAQIESLENRLEEAENQTRAELPDNEQDNTLAIDANANSSSAHVDSIIAEKDEEIGTLCEQINSLKKALSAMTDRHNALEGQLTKRAAEMDERDQQMKREATASNSQVTQMTARISELEARIINQDALLTARTPTLRNTRKAEAESRSTEPGLHGDTKEGLTEALTAKDVQLERLNIELDALKSKQGTDQETIRKLQADLSASATQVAQEKAKAHSRSAEHSDVVKVMNAPKAVTISPEELSVRDRTIKELRLQLLDKEERLEEYAQKELEMESVLENAELAETQQARIRLQTKQQHDGAVKQRKLLVAQYHETATRLIDALQRGLDEYSAVFRDACAVRDEEEDDPDVTQATGNEAVLGTDTDPSSETQDGEDHAFEEYLVLKSGVVIKAGAYFKLPVFCEKPGWRVVWQFTVTEDEADVGFTLAVDADSGERGASRVIVPLERVHALSGIYEAPSSGGCALLFEWDNTFSWLNEKTLDYHVSVQEPLTADRQRVRAQERRLQARAAALQSKLDVLAAERARRTRLLTTLERVAECETAKTARVAELQLHQQELTKEREALHVEMEAMKARLSASFSEMDDMEEAARSVNAAWESIASEREDVEMTMGLSAHKNRLDEHAQVLTERLEECLGQLEALRATEKTNAQG